jgi:hypothetical protein
LLLELQGPAINTKMSESGKWMKRPLREHELREKLILKYKEKVVKEVFPGVGASLPLTFEEVGIIINKGDVEEPLHDDEGWESMSPEEVVDKNLPRGIETTANKVEDLLGKAAG